MSNRILESWADYWKFFDELCLTLAKNDKQNIVDDLKDAQKYVNGLTDGWYEFLYSFQNVVKDNHEMFNVDEQELADFLIKSLEQSLRRR